MNLYNLFLVGVGGFLGSIARYITSRSVDGKLNSFFPYGTLTVNLIGSLLIGILYGWLIRRQGEGDSLRLFFGTGFCGGFTTYSAFALENTILLQQKMPGPSLIYILLTLILGFTLVMSGIFIGKNIS